ncbi:MAG: alpha/beta hydrolase [Candidatus Hinthialibacter antarcticus]|nr:alpha/beta hydrolase [Candidatus Hinthialibacter antarcticus]
MMRTFYIQSTALLTFIFALAAFSADAPPPVPKGFNSETEMKTAALMGMLKVVDVKNVPIPKNVTEHLGIEYGNVDGRSLKLDLYVPQSTKPTPGILFIHGGSWSKGKRGDMKFYAVHFAKLGYAAATISYRLSGEAPFPAAAQDAKCAMRWMRSQAKTYNIDPNRIAVSGNSAGGHLSLMLGYSSDDQSLEGDGGHAKFSSKPQAVIDFYGPVDLTGEDAVDNGFVHKFMGGTIDDVRGNYTKASPISHLTKDDPPTLIFHGTVDSLVNIRHADHLDKQLQALGIEHEYERYEGWGHTMDLAADVNKRCVYIMEKFLAKHL